MKEILLDGINGINDDGDVVAIDHPLWDDEQFEPDHHTDDAIQYSEPKVAVNKVERPGASITLAQRAVAIEAIMGYFNQANKRNGLSRSRGYNGFDARYGRDANEVAVNMSAKETRLYAGFTRAVEALLARDDLIESGFSLEETEQTGKSLAYDLHKKYGPGRAYEKDRTKLVRTVNRTARKAAGSKR